MKTNTLSSNKLSIKYYFTFFLFLFLNECFNAQVYTYQNATKFHYEIISNENDSINKRIYQAAYDYNKFDELRFLNERRIISIKGFDANLVLFSANELLKTYGKKVSPLTILPGQEYKNVEFVFMENTFSTFKVTEKD